MRPHPTCLVATALALGCQPDAGDDASATSGDLPSEYTYEPPEETEVEVDLDAIEEGLALVLPVQILAGEQQGFHFGRHGREAFVGWLGVPEVVLMPIGAYRPRWFMKTVHVDPAEAVLIHKDLNAKVSMAIHWGAFILSAEGVLTPTQDLAEARDAAGIGADEFAAYAVGETRHYPAAPAATVETAAR